MDPPSDHTGEINAGGLEDDEEQSETEQENSNGFPGQEQQAGIDAEDGEEHSGSQNEDEDDEEEDEDEDDHDNGAQESATGDNHNEQEDEEEEDEDVRTFLEFTGSTDKERARQYLIATEGNLEEAVNLFLTGAPPPTASSGSPARRGGSGGSRGGPGGGLFMSGPPDSALPQLLAHLEALAGSGGSRAERGAGGDGEFDSQSQMDSLLADLSEHDVNLSTLARSLMVGSGFSDFVRMTQQQTSQTATQSDSTATSPTTQDDDAYESNATTPAEAKSRLETLARGQMDSAVIVGAHTSRSVASFVTYMEAGLIPAVCSALGRVGSDSALRILQVIESIVLMLCRGLDDAERLTTGWFIPPRRLGSNPRRGRPKSWAIDTFVRLIAPKGDLAWLRRLWRRRELEPSFKNAEGDSLLALACHVGAPEEFIRFLVEYWGLDPHESGGPLGSAIEVMEKELQDLSETKKEEWSNVVLAILSSPSKQSVDEKILEERRTMPYSLGAIDDVPVELRMGAQWAELASALLKIISRSSNVSTVHRAMEILGLILSECPVPVVRQIPAFAGLIAAALSPECQDGMIVRVALKMLSVLAQLNASEPTLIHLCRTGAMFKLSKRTFESEDDRRLAKACVEQVSSKVKGKCDWDGRPKRLIESVKALNARSTEAVTLLANVLADITTFEFEQSKLPDAAAGYFADPAVPVQALLTVVSESASTNKKWRARSSSSSDEITIHDGLDSLGDLQFSFAMSSSGISGNSSGSRFRRSRTNSNGGERDEKRSQGSLRKKVTLLDKLIELSQSILNESVSTALPHVAHDFPGKEDGVRALLNTIPLKLSARDVVREVLENERACEFSMHTLPLTAKKDLERQVLRTGLVANKKYLDFCRRLVGKKVALVIGEASSELHLCTGFDSQLGCHRLKSLVTSVQHWRVMAAARYGVLERVFEYDDANELSAHDREDPNCPSKGALWASECFEGVADDALGFGSSGKIMGTNRIRTVDSAKGPDAVVAVWWEGSPELRPGWRLGLLDSSASALGEDVSRVRFPVLGLMFNDEIQSGSLVRLVSSEETLGKEELAPHVGEIARVASVSGNMVTTYGMGGQVIAATLLCKVRDPEEDGTGPRPQVGNNVAVLSADVTRLEHGVVIGDDGSRLCYLVKDNLTGEVRKVGENEIFSLDPASPTLDIPTRRVISVSSISRANEEHCFGVYILPGSVSGDVPDFSSMSSAQPQPRVFFTITSDGEQQAASTNWSSDEEDANELGSSAKEESQQSRLQLGARIEARFAGKSRWYKGHISRVNADGTYDIAYDDGDTERCLPPALVAAVSSASSSSGAVSENEETRSSAPSQVSMDFRKTFPTHAGKALFDALRREDHVLKSEYNFVTRGFEHQPNFYNAFSTTLEAIGAGVFAQFQTYQQAETLYSRCFKFARDANVGDRVFIRYEPDRRPHPTVIREILAAFSRADQNRMNNASGSGTGSVPPKPGSRALLRVGPDAKSTSLVEASKTSAWIPATVLATTMDVDGSSSVSLVVSTDEGVVFRNVPADQVKDAPTRVASPTVAGVSGGVPQHQHTSRRLSFRTNRAGLVVPSSSPAQPAPRFETPVELTRQFSVFGQTNALRHISVGERSPAPNANVILSSRSPMPSLALATSAGGMTVSAGNLVTSASVTNAPPSVLASLPTRPENQPPQIFVDFDASVSSKPIPLVDEDMEEDTSVFRLVFEQVFNDKKNLSKKGHVLRVRWNSVAASRGITLTFGTRVVFPGEQVPAGRDGETVEEVKQPLRDILDLLTCLYKRGALLVSSPTDWVNAVLSNHFRMQLRDPLSVATRVLPRWVQTLPTRAGFLFMERDRAAYIRAATLGVSRSVAWLQEEVTGYQAKKRELAQLTVEISQLFNQAEPNEARYKRLTQQFERLDDEVKQLKETKFIGQLRQDLVKVDANKLLEDATALMEHHAGERSELVVQFVGQASAGEGVTHEFYGAVAAELQRVANNKRVPMWADPGKATRIVAAEDEDKQDLLRPLGLFPQPLLPSRAQRKAADVNSSVIARFRFLGRLMGQALLDEKTVPLPLAVELFELLGEEQAPIADLNTSTSDRKDRKGRVSIQRVIRLIESDDNSFAEAVTVAGISAPTGDAVVANDESLMMDLESSANKTGVVSTLRRLVNILDDVTCSKSIREAAQTSLESRLSELSLRFVDPSQPLLEVTSSSTVLSSTSASASVQKQHHQNQQNCLDETQIATDDSVAPFVDAPYPQILAFATEWSERGKTNAQIDRALEAAGHSKIARWRVLQATQATRVISTTSTANEDDRFDPAAELIPDGRKVVVDTKNVREYLAAVERHWTMQGIRPQIQAIRAGLADALGEHGASTLLALFSPDALLRMICGEQEVKFNDSDPLLGILLPKGEYSSSSKEIRMLAECLKKMSQAERSQFLSFCTALPRVPSSGLPQIKVFPPTKSRVTALVISSLVNGSSASSTHSDSSNVDDKQQHGDSGTDDSATWPRLRVGDKVTLADGYADVEDAIHGPMQPGDVSEVTNVIMRARVKDWWYHPRALKKVESEDEEDEEEEEEEEDDDDAASQAIVATREDDTASKLILLKEQWFEEGDVVRINETKGVVSAWDASSSTIHLQENTSNRNFRSGRRLTLIKTKPLPEGMIMPKAIFTIKNVVEQCEVVQSPPLLRPKATTCVMALYLPTGYENADHMLQVFRDAFEDAKLGGLQDN